MTISLSTNIIKPLKCELITLYLHKEAYEEICTAWEFMRDKKISCNELGVTLDSMNADSSKEFSSIRVLRKNDLFIWLFENGKDYVNKVMADRFGLDVEIGALGYDRYNEAVKVNFKLNTNAVFDINTVVRKMKKLGFRDEDRVISKIKVILWILERGRNAFNTYPPFVENALTIRPSVYK